MTIKEKDNNKATEFEPIVTSYDNENIILTEKDVWFIAYIRKLGFGRLSDIDIQNGCIVLVHRAETKIKPCTSLK